ncbi:MAG: transaldolase [Desulfobacteraceae bacterium]|nr:MAG: transaldolase [Desulfobacteraceae bacterium]
MKLYVDSAERTAIESLLKTGVFYGVTTNPLILKQAGISMKQLPLLADQAFSSGARELFLQSWGESAALLQEHGSMLADISDKVVVKFPATREGLEAAARLSRGGKRVCITAVYSSYQALLAASVGAEYVAPYLGRMNDAGRDGHLLIRRMADALRNTGSPCEILAASVRTPEDVATLSENGVRCITVSPTVAERFFKESLTEESALAFESAAKGLER